MAGMRSRQYGVALGVAMAASMIAPASADIVAQGVAVGSIGSSTPVGTQNGTGDISYYIPLSGDATQNVVYGTNINTGAGALPNGCSGAYGTCADTGNGGASMTMILRFDFPPAGDANSPGAPYPSGTLNVDFADLDLGTVNDPGGFLESLNVLNSSGTSLTGLITNAGGLVTGDANSQLLTLALNFALTDPVFLQLVFAATFNTDGTNTVESLNATITAVPGPIVGAGIPGLIMACGGLIALARRRRRTQMA